MEPFEEKTMLESMTVLVDSREQPSRRAEDRYKAFGVPYERATLSYGDYTYCAKFPDGSVLNRNAGTVIPYGLVIERKMSLDELEGCFTRDRKRFEAEFLRAQEASCRVCLLVENATWENLFNGRYKNKMKPEAFAASLEAFIVRYNLLLIFCKEETSGRIIHDLLYRDLKERIERGEFDELNLSR